MRKFWTQDEINLVIDLFPNKSARELSTQLGRSTSSINGLVNKLRKEGVVIEKSPEYVKRVREYTNRLLTEAGKSSRFYKGQSSWNEGRHGIRVSPKSEFKKGHKPHNTACDGAVRVRKDRLKSGQIIHYKYIRLAESKWVLYHRYLYEQKFGKLNRNQVVIFIDKNTLNCELSNLKCVSRKELLELNRNVEKATQTHHLMMEEGEHFSHNLTPEYLAGLMARGDRILKEELLQYPDLLESKKFTILIKRKLK